MGIADAVKPVQEVTINEMAQEFADKFAVVSWGTPGVEADNKIQVTMQLKNPLQQNLAVVERLRLTASNGATMALKSAGDGTVLNGSGTDDIIIETDETTGTFDLEVSYSGTGSVTVVAGVTQGSGFASCGATAELVFA